MIRQRKPDALTGRDADLYRRWLLWLALLIVLVIVPFLIWGDELETMMVLDPETGRFGGIPLHAGLAGAILIVADIVLPIPKTAIMVGLGILFGPVVGTLYALAGSMAASIIAYGLGRWLGRPVAERWFDNDFDRSERLFERHGALIVVGSRWMPVLVEVVPIVAGVNRMSFSRFTIAAFIGSLPNCAVFCTLGYLGSDMPVLTLVVSAIAPLVLWFLAVRLGLMKRFET